MKSNRKAVIVPVTLFATLGLIVSIGFNACSEVAFEADGVIDQQSLSLSVPEDVPVTPIVPEEPVVKSVVQNCADLHNSGNLEELHQTIAFEDSKVESGRKEVCQFGLGDNLSSKNGFVRAEYTQIANLNLPQDAVLCSMEIKSSAQTIKYDDMFYLKFNDYIIASNHKSAVNNIDPERITVGNSDVYISKYNWNSLKNSPFGNEASDNYCLGEELGLSSCSWPKTQQTGSFSLQYDNELLVNLGMRAPASQQQLALTVTGDNDASLDCYHSKITINVEVKYYVK